MKIIMVGTGYVGLVSGTCFAETGVDVVCVDVDKQKIDKLKEGIMTIYEPGLEDMVASNLEKGRLKFSTSLKDNLEEADAVFIAVGTPPDEDGSADLRYVIEVAREIGRNMNHYMVVVTKSTVPIGTSAKVRSAVIEEQRERGVEIPFDVASNPEFLKEGSAIGDFLKPERIIVGTDSEDAEKMMRRLYKPFVLNNHPIIFMDIPSAELTKYAANSMLATRISFMNDIANLCELVGADINSVRRGIGSDSRIGSKFIYAGAGYGGSCFPKDVKALIRTADESNYSLEILKAVENVNQRQKEVLFNKVMDHFEGNIAGKRIAIWGLSFKPRTDDMREAPVLVIIDKLIQAGASVIAYDPVAIDEARRKLGDSIEYASDQYEALVDAEALLLVTEWNDFRTLNYKVLSKLMKNKLVFDGRNLYEPSEMKEFGFTYYGIGRRLSGEQNRM
ncbi:MAG: UDP-glucose/GDP-mannose dehydrogenase family protein [Marinilabiliales bacterium]|nr:MAG: UDP-glucose/GDP-mannose dehydrogenase family protein [Marinilabiliales bacterium]